MRIAVLTLIFMACGAPAMAQISYGVKGGINFADLAFDEGDIASTGRPGPLAGGFATIPLLGWLALQPEVIYTVKGATVTNAGVEADLIVDYFEVPLLARVPVRRSLYVAVGPSMAFRVRAKSRTPFGDSIVEIDVKEEVEAFDLGVVGAAGFEFGRWVVDGRYTHGLSDIDADTTDNVKMRHRVFSLSAGIRF
jgi:hypothetical protein